MSELQNPEAQKPELPDCQAMAAAIASATLEIEPTLCPARALDNRIKISDAAEQLQQDLSGAELAQMAVDVTGRKQDEFMLAA